MILLGKFKKQITVIISVIVGCVFLYFGAGEFQEYKKKKELQERIDFLDGEIEKIKRGETSEYAENLRDLQKEDALSRLSLSKFSARSDGTFVKAFGTITNNSSQSVDDILSIAFFDENGEIITVKRLIVKIEGGTSMHFEELIGLTRDGTPIPKSAQLQN